MRSISARSLAYSIALAGAILVAIGVLTMLLWSVPAGAAVTAGGVVTLATGIVLRQRAGRRAEPRDTPATLREPFPDRPLEYFCYISRSKVDQLYEQIQPGANDEVTELRSSETTIGGGANVGLGVKEIGAIFKAGATYGRKGLIQRETKVKSSYVEKLERVLLEAARKRPIPDATTAIGDETGAGFFYYRGRFLADAVDLAGSGTRGVATIASELPDGRRMLLDCSLRFFSEGTLPDGTFTLNSANARFFEGDISLKMATVFLLLDSRNDRVVGSPLFLKLELASNNDMTAL